MTDEQKRLVEDNTRLVNFALQKFCPDPQILGGEEDAWQIGCIGLCKAAINYDPCRGGKFSTLAVRCIRNELWQALRRAMGPKRYPEKAPASLDRLVGDDNIPLHQVIPDPDADTERQAETDRLHERMARAFEAEPVLFLAATKQITQQEASQLLGLSQPEISRRIRDILQMDT